MSIQYALIKNNIVTNIVVANEDFMLNLVNEGAIDSYVQLTDENFFNQVNKAEIGSHYHNNNFIPKSWTKNGENYVAPIEMPQDGNYYEWREDYNSWLQMTPYPSWSWDSEMRIANPPIPMPTIEENSSFYYEWDEQNLSWKQVEKEI